LNGYLTPQDVAKVLHKHINTVWKYLLSGELKGYKPGGRNWLIKTSDLEAFIEGRGTTGSHTEPKEE